MAKRGRKSHLKRLAIPKTVPLSEKKEYTWLLRSEPGPHNAEMCIPIGVLLRNVLKLANTAKEAKKVIWARDVLVNGKARTELKFPIGFMDIIEMPKLGKSYRIELDRKGRLKPVEIGSDEAKTKINQVVKKTALPGGKMQITLHDGRTFVGDNDIKVGDSVMLSVPDFKFKGLLKVKKGARCYIVHGKHSGTIAVVEEMLKGGRKAEARMKGNKEAGEFITVADYLFVIDDSIKGVANG
ncbi:MAG: 30S ribosomal protein S4e [Candidatus Bilamarchaeaceae archaeon]